MTSADFSGVTIRTLAMWELDSSKCWLSGNKSAQCGFYENFVGETRMGNYA